VARCFARDVTLYDGSRAVRTFHTLMQPYSVSFLPQQLGGGAGAPGQLISLTEGHLVSVYSCDYVCIYRMQFHVRQAQKCGINTVSDPCMDRGRLPGLL
jgi:hypothetical protein